MSRVLSNDELKRRIAAARILRGIKQADLQASLAADGLGKTELGRIERGKLPLTKVRREVLAGALGVPERWFLSENVDEIVGWATLSEGGAVHGPPESGLRHRLESGQPTEQADDRQDLPGDSAQHHDAP